MTSIKSYWHVSENFGDALTPYLIKKITGLDVEFAEANSIPAPFMVTGSILGCEIRTGKVWGNGSAFHSDLNPVCFTEPSDDFKIYATRGFLSKKLVELAGHQPLACGDPGILLPRFYTSNVPKKYKLGIMCSWVDYDQVLEQYQNPDVTVINSMGPVEIIIDKINECEVLATSTLHGFITAVAYNIPSLLVKFSDKMVGDDFKYQDFFTCLNNSFYMFDLRNKIATIDELIGKAIVHRIAIDLDALFNCCPFRAVNDSSL